MTHWNYRVVRMRRLDQDLYSIVEVYYEGDEIVAWVDPDQLDPLSNWDSPDELLRVHELIGEAFGRPVLVEDDLPTEGES